MLGLKNAREQEERCPHTTWSSTRRPAEASVAPGFSFYLRTTSGALLVAVSALLNRVVLELQLLAYPLFIEPYDDLAVYDGGGGGLGVDLDHLLHGVQVGADILLDKIDVSLR